MEMNAEEWRDAVTGLPFVSHKFREAQLEQDLREARWDNDALLRRVTVLEHKVNRLKRKLEMK